MRKFHLKHGFLSIYRCTVFIRRVTDCNFEVSLPVDYRATCPILRECFAAFAAMADNDRAYMGAPEFNTILVRDMYLNSETVQLCRY